MHRFEYQGSLSGYEKYKNIEIRFQNFGNVIFKNTSELRETSSVGSNGQFLITGEFETVCESDNDIVNETDSLSFEIMSEEKLIKKGRFSVVELSRLYDATDYKTTLKLPKIKL